MKILQIGLGSMGKRRIRCFHALGEKDIVAWDPRVDRREEAARLYGVRTVDTVEAGMAEDPQILSISTPPDRHYEYCALAGRNGKHWFCEANIVTEGAQELAGYVAGGLVGAPSATLRFHPLYMDMEQAVRDRVIGEPRLLTFSLGQNLYDWHPWEGLNFYAGRKETGAGREMVTFEFQWLTWMFGRVKSVQAAHGAYQGLPGDVDDAYLLVVEFESGLVGNVSIDVIARPPVREGRLQSENGTIQWDIIGKTLKLYRHETQAWETLRELPSDYSMEEMYVREIDTFLRAVRGEGTWPLTYEADEHLEHILLAAELSHREGRRVEVAEMEQTAAA